MPRPSAHAGPVLALLAAGCGDLESSERGPPARTVRSALLEAVGRSASPEYSWIPAPGEVHRAESPAQGLALAVEGSELRVTWGSGAWAELELLELPPGVPGRADGGVLRRVGAEVEERLSNGPLGLHQRLRVHEGEGELVLRQRLSTSAAVQVLGSEVVLRPRRGPALHIGGLSAWDADGRALPARFELRPGRLDIVVGATGARFPVDIDPLVSTGRQPLFAGDERAADGLGAAVDADGDVAAVGLPNDFVAAAGERTGSVLVFRRDSGGAWSESQRLVSDTPIEDGFGGAVALDGTTLVVGAQTYGAVATDAGAAYVFEEVAGAFTQVALLTASDAARLDRFGVSVAASGTRIAVGAFRADSATVAGGGAVYLFERGATGWQEAEKLAGSDTDRRDELGWSVDLDRDTLLAGAPGADLSAGFDAGAAYVFVRGSGGWQQQAKLTAFDAAQNDELGFAVAVDGDRAAAGAPRDDDGATDGGSVYFFSRAMGTWSSAGKASPSPAAADRRSGADLDLDGTTAIAGHTSNVRAGDAFVFTLSGSTWSQQAVLTSTYSDFGRGVALDGRRAFVGPDGATLDTSVRVLERSGTSWVGVASLVNAPREAPGGYAIDVDVDGDRAIVGAPFDPLGVGGRIYLFERSRGVWAEVAAFQGGGGFGELDDEHGISVALDGDFAVAGAPGKDVRIRPGSTLQDAGVVYVYERTSSGWRAAQTVESPRPSRGNEFGAAVAVDGATLVVGEPDDDPIVIDEGSVWVFDRGANGRYGTGRGFRASDADRFDRFGAEVAVSGSRILVGVPFDDAPGRSSGSVYFYERTGSSTFREQKVVASDGAAGAQFGAAVALTGTTAAVGARREAANGTGAGAVYVYTATTSWGAEVKLTASDAQAGMAFGTAVGLDGDVLAVGSPASGTREDGVYLFERQSGTWREQFKLTAQGFPPLGFGNAVAVSGARAVLGDRSAGYAEAIELQTVAPLANGTACASGAQCRSGHCVDGVCCNSACAAPCEACSAAAGAAMDGTCGFLASGIACRPAAGLCDLAETCTGTAAACPPDRLASSSTRCRPSSGLCDPAESCTGTQATCPPDAVASASSVCRAAAGDCDRAETCDGSSPTCPVDAFEPAGTTCRAAAGLATSPRRAPAPPPPAVSTNSRPTAPRATTATPRP